MAILITGAGLLGCIPLFSLNDGLYGYVQTMKQYTMFK